MNGSTVERQLSTVEFENVVKQVFRGSAESYGDELTAFWINDHIKKARDGCHEFDALLEEKLQEPPSLDVLDLCCGWGEFVVNFRKRGIKCYGIDISDTIYHGLVLARENSIPSSFINGDVYSLPFKSDFFDVVYSFSALEHIERPQELLKQIYRVIKPGGSLFLTFPNPLYPIDGHTFLWFVPYLPHRLAGKYVKLRKKRRATDHWDVWYHKRRHVNTWAKRAGFTEIGVYPPNRLWGRRSRQMHQFTIKHFILKIADFFNINISKYWNITSDMIFLIMAKS